MQCRAFYTDAHFVDLAAAALRGSRVDRTAIEFALAERQAGDALHPFGDQNLLAVARIESPDFSCAVVGDVDAAEGVRGEAVRTLLGVRDDLRFHRGEIDRPDAVVGHDRADGLEDLRDVDGL